MKKRVYGTNGTEGQTAKKGGMKKSFLINLLLQLMFVAIALGAIALLLTINNWWGDVLYWLNPFSEGNQATIWVYLAIILLGCIAGVMIWKKKVSED